MTVTADESYVMMVDVARGLTPEGSRLAPLTGEQRAKWDRLAAEIADIRSSGMMEAIPFEN